MRFKHARIRRSRNQQRTGSGTILLTVCLVAILVIVGLSVCNLIGLLGGACQLQDLADSAALNVGKQQLKLAVPLSSGLEQQNFSFVSDDGQVNLLNYNRIIGQLLLVSMNAEAEQMAGSSSALSHANQLWNTVQGGENSLSKRLSVRLVDSSSASMPVDTILGASNLHMLPVQAAEYQRDTYNVAYINEGDSTNVYLDDGLIPDGANLTPDCLSNPKGKAAHKFIKGYKGISISSTFTIQGAPVMPGSAPHLVSNSKFAAHTKSPLNVGFVPPNCFQSACKVRLKGSALTFNACASVGSLQGEYAASIPGGYIEIANGGSSSGTIMELIAKAGLNAQNDLVPQLVQRLRQIQPEMSEASVVDWLDGVKLASGQRAFLCFDPQLKQMKADKMPPSNYVDGTAPDGKEQTFGNADLTTLNYTPSSGYNNLLGVIKLNDNTEHFGLEHMQALAEADKLALAEKNTIYADKAVVRAAVDRVKAEVELQKARADENRMLRDRQEALTQRQDADKAAETAKKDEKAAKEAIAAAQADLKKARTDKEKAAALERAAAAEMRRAKAEELAADKAKVKEELDKQHAERDQKLANLESRRVEAERKEAAQEQELARISIEQSRKDEQVARLLFQQATGIQPPVASNQQPAAVNVGIQTFSQSKQVAEPATDGSSQRLIKIARQSVDSTKSEALKSAPQSIVRMYKWN